MIEIVVTIVGTFISLFVLMRQKKARQDPLKNTERVAVEINSQKSLDAFVVYLPTTHFVKNMTAAIDTEMGALRAKWSSEKATFGLIWKGFSEQQRKSLVGTLLDELKFSIEIYSDAKDLLSILCPKLFVENLLNDVNIESTHSAIVDHVEEAPILRYLLAAQNKADIKQYCLPLLILKAEQVEREVDPNAVAPVDVAVMEQVDLFLRALQYLCVIKFAKQILLRYKLEPQKSMVARLVKKVGPLVLFGALAAFITYLMDKYGVLDVLLWNYKSK